MARLFIGVWLEPKLREEVANLIETVRQECQGFKWTLPEQLHFTLKFLGEVDIAQEKRLSLALDRVPEALNPFTLSLGNVGGFPKLANPRIVWLGVSEGEKPLCALADFVETAAARADFELSDKPFQPHLTLGRAKRDMSPRLALPQIPVFKNATCVRAFYLIQSQLTPSGAIYRNIREFPLKGS